MNKNDKKIMALKEKIEIKKQFLKENKPVFTLKTNCIFTLFGQKHNLHTLSDFELKLLFNIFNQIGNPDTTLENIPLKDWMTDIMTIQVKKDYDTQSQNLKKLEAKLDALISDETKTKLEIDELEKLI